MQKIVPNLWFDDNAQNAVDFYLSIFPNSRIIRTSYYHEAGPRPKGTIMTIDFQLDNQLFTALNGGPEFTFTHAVSFLVNCQNQEEVDSYWEKLSEGGKKEVCGWLVDKFGVSWQIIPTILGELINDPDTQKSNRVMEAMLQMEKIDIAALKQAAEPA